MTWAQSPDMTRRAQVYNGQSSSYLCAGKQQEFLVLFIARARGRHSEHSVVGQYEQGSWGLETDLLKVLAISEGQSLVPAPSPEG